VRPLRDSVRGLGRHALYLAVRPLAVLLCLALALAACGRGPSRAGARADAGVRAAGPPASQRARPARQAQVWVTGDRLQVGYDAEVTLQAETAPGTPPLRYRWEQATGPDVRASMRADGPTLKLRTRPLAELVRARKRFGVLPIAAHEIGTYGFRLYADGPGLRAVVPVEVRAAESDGEWPRAVPGRDRYLTCGGGAGPWSWAITRRAFGSKAPVLREAETCTPRFRPDVHGLYEITEQTSRRAIAIDVGPWFGATDCGRAECHPREHERWLQTKHGSIVRRGLEGEIRGYDFACLRCHAVGALEQNVLGKGFDEAAALAGWGFPAQLGPGTWARVPAPVKSVLGVGCDNCHAPGFYWTGWGVAACARCHDAPPRYVRFQEWRASRAAASEPLPPSPKTTDGSCARCHTAQGFVEWTRRDPPPKRDWKKAHPIPPGTAEAFGRSLRDLEPQTPHACLACHAPHPAKPTHASLREAPPGTPYAWLGTGQLCAACHRQPAGLRDDDAPHRSIEAELMGGEAAARAGVSPTRPSHAKVPNGCVGCHMARPRSWRRGDAALARGGHTFKATVDGEVCRGCHARGAPPPLDYAKELPALRAALEGVVRARTGAVTFDARDGRMVLVNAKGAVQPIADPALRRAVYAYFVLRADRSGGVHNPGLARRLLTQPLGALK
jgi:hypothetical protein